MSKSAWRSSRPFLRQVCKVDWSFPEERDLDFLNDVEVLYATLFSIVEYSDLKGDELIEAGRKLNDFAVKAQIYDQRQDFLQKKVQKERYGAGWDARTTISKHSKNFDLFFRDFVYICLQDRIIQPEEDDLIKLICCRCLGHGEDEIKALQEKVLSEPRYRAICFFSRIWVSNLITVLIILNALQFGLATCSWFKPYQGSWFRPLDLFFICIFTVEILCRIFAFRRDFFRQPQNIFDFVVVAASLIPSPVCHGASALRVLRTMLLLNRLTQLKAIMKSLLDALPSIGWVSILLLIVYYVFAVLTTNLFGNEFASFESIDKSFFSLFQLMTLESWPELLVPICDKHPYAWLVFLPFIVLTSYIFLNLVIGIIVAYMQDISQKKTSPEMERLKELTKQMETLQNQLERIQQSLDRSSGKNK